ncbi:TPA: prephenate dehydrogenase/arogenate dehydrogenase family protein [Candidatus Bathyarchaeota archaeon]|nr:prephenate dehydrogenase/arogenate dehydrogenase family protein [Candidatus Bathyarchaeota archaeon]
MIPWKEVAIVGGYGRMGRFFARVLSRDGFHVTICGRRLERARRVARRLGVSYGEVDSSVRGADLVIVSVPIDATYDVCMSVAKEMERGSTIVEIASVKTGIADRLRSDLPRHVRFVSAHPLFGPTVRGLRGRNVVIIKGGDEEATRRLRLYLESKGASVSLLTVDEHDRAMATVQVLHHYALLSFSYVLQNELRRRPKLADLLTESLRLTLRSVKRVLDNLDAVLEIQERNPYAGEARREFVKAIAGSLEQG